VFLFVGLCFTSISGNQINNQTINSSGRGDILYVGGSGPNNYTTIQSAIDDASHGDTVFVYKDSSPYYGVVVINKSICFADTVTISGFTIQNSCKGSTYDAGINIRETSNHIIQNNIFRNNHHGIVLEYSHINDIFENDFYENYRGLYVSDGYYNTVKNNKFSNNERHGIMLEYSQYNTITKNIIEKNGFLYIGSYSGGIYLDVGARTNLIFENVISDNYHGIFVRGGYRYNKISRNMILNNAFCGIVLAYYSGETEIEFNHIEGNGRFGIYIDKSEHNNISNNNFIDNKERNIVSLCFLFQDMNLEWSGNYYDDYKGFGSKIIFGLMKSTREFDFYTPFFWIPWFYFDRNPAKVPYDITTTQGCGIE
jgi:parallel beta-helix repeat protein